MVELRRLDDDIPQSVPIHLIKIDVEGGEFDGLKGSENILRANKPYVIFEFEIGGSDYYGTKPEELFRFFTETIGLKVSLMDCFLKNDIPLEKEDLELYYNSKKEYYFIAHPEIHEAS